MLLKEVIEELQKIEKEYGGDIDFQVSVDMSRAGDEDTYADRVFGTDPYLVRIVIEHDEFFEHKYAQVLFESGYDNRSLNE